MKTLIPFIAIFASGCASAGAADSIAAATALQSAVDEMNRRPPAILLSPCNAARPPEKLETNADLATYLSAVLEAFDICAAKQAAIIQYYE